MIKRIKIILACTLLFSFCTSAQFPGSGIDSSRKLFVRQVTIKGNKKTKEYIILREAQLNYGDSIPGSTIAKRFEQSRQNVYNTTLFNEVKLISTAIGPDSIDVLIEVKERWYIIPSPQFQLVDRNFNEWIQTYKADFSRVNYGLKFQHKNFSGRRDDLQITLLNGYTRNISFSYSTPYSNSRLNNGFSVRAGFSQNREVGYNISYDNDSTLFYPGKRDKSFLGSFVRTNFFAEAGYSIRNGIFNKQRFALSYNYQKIDDSLLFYNPNYFKSNTRTASFLEFAYNYEHTNVNNVGYPLNGKRYFVSLIKRGLGFTSNINMFSVEGGYSQYFDMGKGWYASARLHGKIKLPFDQAYINQRGLGFGQAYLRGHEIYIIDGVAYLLNRNTLKKKILYFKIPLPFKSKSHPSLPITVFAKTYGDLGYSYNKKKYDTYLNNRLLYSGGFGIDILTLYDVNFRFEYSFNQLGKNGLFLHTQDGL